MSNYASPLSKTELLNAIAEDTGLQRKEVKAVLDSLSGVIAGHVAPGAAGVFKMPGLLKISVVNKPATEARYGVANPFRPGETMDVAAKPASRRVKILALKNLKDMAS
ncbi:MAG: DNA-binding protein [Proteobacteria bacterium]|jgi:nucleoid DNA-binding protein|nr:DNA-binding protein [Pseudomonadota bacterium]|tara:strand:- start:1766 stop:2089 length:324 start_codon:yes stop_codon:yes gene_type:complete